MPTPAIDWSGVFPATTTQFKADESLDLEASLAHLDWLLSAGVDGFIVLGTLGENTALEPAEKRALLEASVRAVKGRVPVLSGVAECSTAAACRFASDAKALGADGLMVLPGMVYKADGPETMAHLRAVAGASDLPIMIYNNPVTYGVDLTAEDFAALSSEPSLAAIKESSDDIRRLSDIHNAVGERYGLFCGVDDLAMEAALNGAAGWVAGLVNAFPEETVRLWRLCRKGRWEEARELNRWFMPLLHLDCHPKLVQYIKLAQAMAGRGSETVRMPRQTICGPERERVTAIIQAALDSRPKLAAA